MVMVTSVEKVHRTDDRFTFLFFFLLIGFLSKLERKTHIDFNGDNIIGRPPDVYYGYPPMYATGYGRYPSMGYGGYPSMRYSGYTEYGPRRFGYF